MAGGLGDQPSCRRGEEHKAARREERRARRRPEAAAAHHDRKQCSVAQGAKRHWPHRSRTCSIDRARRLPLASALFARSPMQIFLALALFLYLLPLSRCPLSLFRLWFQAATRPPRPSRVRPPGSRAGNTDKQQPSTNGQPPPLDNSLLRLGQSLSQQRTVAQSATIPSRNSFLFFFTLPPLPHPPCTRHHPPPPPHTHTPTHHTHPHVPPKLGIR